MSDSTTPEPEPKDEPDPYLVLGHLSSTVVHQVVNFFSTIVSQAEILKTRFEAGVLSQAEAAARTDAIVKAAIDGSTLSRNLADFSRKATALGAVGAAEDMVDLGQLLNRRVDAQKRRSGAKTEWIVDLAAPAKLPGNASHLRVMIDHLLENAREALSADGGVIKVSTTVDSGGSLVLEIRDDGEGMRTELLEHVLDPFFTTKPGHAGLGMALARGIWRRHRGAFSIETTPGRGTVIRLSCPPPSFSAQPTSPKPDDGAA